MIIENKYGIIDSAEFARVEEKVSKTKAMQLFESGLLDTFEVGTFEGLKKIHKNLFDEIYDFAGEIRQVVDWSRVDKEDYLLAMERSPIKDVEIKALLKNALTDKINDREVYMKGIDASYYYEGYNVFKTENLNGIQ